MIFNVYALDVNCLWVDCS